MIEKILIVIALELLIIVSITLLLSIYFIFSKRAEQVKDSKEQESKAIEEDKESEELKNKIKQWENLLNYNGREQEDSD